MIDSSFLKSYIAMRKSLEPPKVEDESQECCGGVRHTKMAQRYISHPISCDYCNGTGEIYISDGGYGPCDCDYPVGPWTMCDVCEDCGWIEINRSRKVSMRRIRAHLNKMIIKKDAPIINRLESLFSNGMGWSNRKDWHIDHIKPIKVFLDEGVIDVDVINHPNNLQPLWAKENLLKGCKY